MALIFGGKALPAHHLLVVLLALREIEKKAFLILVYTLILHQILRWLPRQNRLANHVLLVDALRNISLPWYDWVTIVEKMVIQRLLVFMLALEFATLALQHIFIWRNFFSVVNAGRLAWLDAVNQLAARACVSVGVPATNLGPRRLRLIRNGRRGQRISSLHDSHVASRWRLFFFEPSLLVVLIHFQILIKCSSLST